MKFLEYSGYWGKFGQITLITLKMYINKILHLLSFICFLFHVNMSKRFWASYGILKF